MLDVAAGPAWTSSEASPNAFGSRAGDPLLLGPNDGGRSDRVRCCSVVPGADPLGAIRSRRPDLVLSDVMMLRMDRFGLLRALRAEPDTRTLPFIRSDRTSRKPLGVFTNGAASQVQLTASISSSGATTAKSQAERWSASEARSEPRERRCV
jgi:CheY-like chemotaxis protein